MNAPTSADLRSLDAALAQKLLGYEWWHAVKIPLNKLLSPESGLVAAVAGESQPGRIDTTLADLNLAPHCSTILTDAWRVVDALHALGECLTLTWCETIDAGEWGWRWLAEFRMSGAYAVAPTPALAISHAALIAIDRLLEPAQ